MNTLSLIGSLLALATYFPLWKQLSNKTAKQNLFTWGLWCVIDVIATATVVAQHGNYLLPLTYTVGSAVTVVFIAKSGDKPAWTWFESLVAASALACMVIWYFAGDRVATIASTLAMVVAGTMQVVDAWRRPEEMPLPIYASYVIANVFSVAGGRDWSVQERFYPMTALVFCLLFVFLAARKYWRKSPDAAVVS